MIIHNVFRPLAAVGALLVLAALLVWPYLSALLVRVS